MNLWISVNLTSEKYLLNIDLLVYVLLLFSIKIIDFKTQPLSQLFLLAKAKVAILNHQAGVQGSFSELPIPNHRWDQVLQLRILLKLERKTVTRKLSLSTHDKVTTMLKSRVFLCHVNIRSYNNL